MQERKRRAHIRLASGASIFDVLGEPHLLDEDEKSNYARLRDFLSETLEPEGFVEYHEISDFAWRRVKQLRLELAEADLIDGPFVLAEQLEFICGENVDMARRLALDCGDSDDEKVSAAAEIIVSEGLSGAQLRGNAISRNLAQLHILERLMQSIGKENRRSTKMFNKMIKRRAARLEDEKSAAKSAVHVFAVPSEDAQRVMAQRKRLRSVR